MNYTDTNPRETGRCGLISPPSLQITDLFHEVIDRKASLLDIELNNLKRAYDVFLEPSDKLIFSQEENTVESNTKNEEEYIDRENEQPTNEFFESGITEGKQNDRNLLNDDQECKRYLCYFKGTIPRPQNHTKHIYSEESNKLNWNKPSHLESLSDLRQHKTQEHMFHCSLCSKRFKRQRLLLAHMPVHSEDKSYKCPMCDKVFQAHRYFVRHLERHDREVEPSLKTTLAEEQVYECNICQKDFAKKESLAKHMRIHTRDLLKCSLCDFTCNKKVSLKMHVVSHEGNRKYKCSKCDFSFKQVGHLKRHMKRFNH